MHWSRADWEDVEILLKLDPRHLSIFPTANFTNGMANRRFSIDTMLNEKRLVFAES